MEKTNVDHVFDLSRDILRTFLLHGDRSQQTIITQYNRYSRKFVIDILNNLVEKNWLNKYKNGDIIEFPDPLQQPQPTLFTELPILSVKKKVKVKETWYFLSGEKFEAARNIVYNQNIINIPFFEY